MMGRCLRYDGNFAFEPQAAHLNVVGHPAVAPGSRRVQSSRLVEHLVVPGAAQFAAAAMVAVVVHIDGVDNAD